MTSLSPREVKAPFNVHANETDALRDVQARRMILVWEEPGA